MRNAHAGFVVAAIALVAGVPAAFAQLSAERVVSPDGRTAVFTRLKDAGDGTACAASPNADEIWQSRSDGGDARLLIRGRKGSSPENQLCGFYDLQFSSDGTRLVFISQAWATSGALHEIDLTTGRERYVMPANDVIVLSFCDGENRDRLLVEQHRYFQIVLGSFDWYWLYSPDGSSELAAVGEVNDRNALIRQARQDSRCTK